MRESRTFGSVGGEGGNVLAYPAISYRFLEAAKKCSRLIYSQIRFSADLQ
jgi:hypothetical protein